MSVLYEITNRLDEQGVRMTQYSVLPRSDELRDAFIIEHAYCYRVDTDNGMVEVKMRCYREDAKLIRLIRRDIRRIRLLERLIALWT